MAVKNQGPLTPGILKKGLARDSAISRVYCLGADVIAAYYEHSLNPDEADRCNVHLAGCSPCRSQVAAMSRSDLKPGTRSKQHLLWGWRWIASAAALLMILTVWTVWRSRPVAITPASTAPLVALSKPVPSIPPQEASPSLSGGTPADELSRPPVGVSPGPRSSASSLAPRAAKEKPAPDLPSDREKDTDSNGLSSDDSVARPRSHNPLAKTRREASAEGMLAPAPSPSFEANNSIAASDNSAAKEKAMPGSAGSKTVQTQSATTMNPLVGNKAGKPTPQLSEIIIATPDSKTLWRIAGGDFIERSTNGGATWHGRAPVPGARLLAGAAPTAKICWLVGEDGMILFTKDANRWTKILPPVPAHFVAVTAQSASFATVTTAEGQKFSTSNGGKKWIPLP